MNTTITKRFSNLPFAHRLMYHQGHCKNLHGHNWVFEITFAADRRDENGFIIDFGKLSFVKEKLSYYFDHTVVLQYGDPLFDTLTQLGQQVRQIEDPTTEGVAKFIFHDINGEIMLGDLDLQKRGVRVVKVVAWEDEKNSATYSV